MSVVIATLGLYGGFVCAEGGGGGAPPLSVYRQESEWNVVISKVYFEEFKDEKTKIIVSKVEIK